MVGGNESGKWEWVVLGMKQNSGKLKLMNGSVGASTLSTLRPMGIHPQIKTNELPALDELRKL